MMLSDQRVAHVANRPSCHDQVLVAIRVARRCHQLEMLDVSDIPNFQSASATDFDVFVLSHQGSALLQSPLINPIPTVRLSEHPNIKAIET